MSAQSKSNTLGSPFLMSIQRSTWVLFGCIALLVLLASLYSPRFLSPEYLLQQLKVAAFLGVIASGMMLVILLGHIDLSVPWVATSGAMMACATAALGGDAAMFAIPVGVACGAAAGLISGLSVAYLRIPSMIITMGINATAQGLMVVYSGGFAPPDSATPAMRYAATGALIPGVPNGVLVWLIIGLVVSFLLRRTKFGRSLYAIGNRERAAFLSGIKTERIVTVAFVLSGSLSAFGGVLLAGYAAKAGQAMGDAYLLPAIAAVVLGGTHILGGRGTYIGTVAGVILITLLQSVLSVMQIEEWGRQLIYGVAVVGMLLIYGRQQHMS